MAESRGVWGSPAISMSSPTLPQTQNNLGDALRALGERESGTARLEEVVAVYRRLRAARWSGVGRRVGSLQHQPHRDSATGIGGLLRPRRYGINRDARAIDRRHRNQRRTLRLPMVVTERQATVGQ